MLVKLTVISLTFVQLHFLLGGVVGATTAPPTCEQLIKKNCSEQVDMCSLIMFRIYQKCQNLFVNEDLRCTPACRDELKKLDTSNVGKMFMNCQCQGVKCLAYKDRFVRCHNDVYCGKKDKKCRRKSCTNVDKKCKKNETCNRRHKKYFEACAGLIDGYNCTTNCLRATKRYFDFKLKKHTMRERLAKCNCDGTMEDARTCHNIRRNRQKLCANRLTEI